MGAYTNIDDPSAHFQVATYTGTGNADNSITNDGNSNLQPDWIWFKSRDAGHSHYVVDSSRGRDKGVYPDGVNSEVTSSGSTTDCQSFDSDGFTVGSPEDANSTNSSGSTKVAWQWKANGGTTSSNSDGSVSSTVQVNSDAGFSIVKWTGGGSVPYTVGHGLGAIPDFYIVKSRSSTLHWFGYHERLGANKQTLLALNYIQTNTSVWNNTKPTSSVFSIGHSDVNNGDMIGYFFAQKQGYSRIYFYRGNGSSDGPIGYCGFRPAYILIRPNASGSSWSIYDHKRNTTHNPVEYWLRTNGADAESESTISGDDIDILSTGFKLRNNDGTLNANNTDYMYIAFAEHPFVTSGGTPTTAR